MGRGDKKTKKGKRVLGSYGNKRRKNRTPLYVAPVKKKAPVKAAPVEEVIAKTEEVVEVAETKTVAPKKTVAKKAAPKKTTIKKIDDAKGKAAEKPKATKKTTTKKAAPKKDVKEEKKD